MKIKNRHLKKLGFNLVFVKIEESGDTPFCYWDYDLKDDSDFVVENLISNEFDLNFDQNDFSLKKIYNLSKNFNWNVRILSSNLGICTEVKDLKNLIKLLEKK